MLTWEIMAAGRVQGVGFRRYAQTCARQCHITGWISNLHDGNVLITATGYREDLEFFCNMLRTGTRYIDVRELQVREQNEMVEYYDFTIR